MAASTVQHLRFVLDTFFPAEMSLQQALRGIFAIAAVYPLLALHRRQRVEPRQPEFTAWMKAMMRSLTQYFRPEDDDLDGEDPDNLVNIRAYNICRDIEGVYDLLGFSATENTLKEFSHFPDIILTTRHRSCIRCPPETTYRSLRLHEKENKVKVLGRDLCWKNATLFIAHCRTCGADYYPDRITFKDNADRRKQTLDFEASHFRISKHGLWCDRSVATMQENAVGILRSGWANFAKYVNGSISGGPLMTYRQSQRLFMEHFARRLLQFHHLSDDFIFDANPSTTVFAGYLRDVVGKNGGVLKSALRHGCMDCTHQKRYRSDLVDEGAILDAGNGGGMAQGPAENLVEEIVNEEPLEDMEIELPAGLPPHPPVQQAPPANGERGYVRMVVMDGKTIGHRICALDDCKEPLVNFKNGRFCEAHLEVFRDVCGIIPRACGEHVRGPGELTCNNPAHIAWHGSWSARFERLSYPHVSRVIRQQRHTNEENPGDRPQFRIRLPDLGDTPGDEVVHVFRARSIYCLETVQWACGMPVGWGKCYKSESAPQVLAFLNGIWQDNEELRPSFVTYDDACDLLRHIVTQDPQDGWLKSTKFVVDAWHYIGHKATDVLCRLWCNPAPTNGSQPDLVVVQHDANGNTHQTRAFNTETAEQLNAWLSGYEAALRQMTDVNFDIFVHVLMMLFAEETDRKILKKERGLDDEFWAGVGVEMQ